MGVLVTPSEVTENRPMLDLLWRAVFRWRMRPHHVTGDGKYGTAENVAALERSGVRAYVAPHESGSKPGFFAKGEFRYDPEKDAYVCPAGELLRRAEDAAAGASSTAREPPSATPARSEPSVHHQLPGAQRQPLPRRRVSGEGTRLRRDRALPQGAREAQGVGRAALCGGQDVAWAVPLSLEDPAAGQRRGLADRRWAEPQEAARLRASPTQGAGPGGGPRPAGHP